MENRMSCKQCEDGYSPMYDINDGYGGEIVQCANFLATTQNWWCGADNENTMDSNKNCKVQHCDRGSAGSKGTAGNCNKCKSSYNNYYDNNCHKCQQGYYFKNGNCKKCAEGCSSCTETYCQICLEGYYGIQVPGNNQSSYTYQCIACEVGCSSCTSKECSICKTGFYLQSGVCVTCPNTCSLCSTTSAECLSCATNYVFLPSPLVGCESCISFDSYCKTCDPGYQRRCYECQIGYYPSLTTYKCTKCSLTCESNGCNTYTGVCQTCADNYTIITNSNTACELCTSYDSNCETCSKTTRKCNKCKAGYYPQIVYPYKCILCDITCNGQCDATTGYCTSCIPDYVLTLNRNSLKCESCQIFEPNCKSCAFNGERKCLTCVNKYKPASNGTCIKCDSTCLDNCDGTSGICTKCVSGYVPYNPTQTTCQECTDFDTKCINCATNNTRICNECKLPFYPSQSGQNIGQCIECDSTCSICSTKNGICENCKTGTVYTEPMSIRCEMCSTFDSNCVTCSVDSSRVCTTCKSGLRPNTTSGKCVGCGLHCVSGACNPTSGICNQCDTNYVFQSTKTDQCESCSTFDANCITCASDSTRKCKQCKAGYYPKTSGDYKCQSCDATCGGKCDTTTGMCAGCTSGYVPTSPITNKCVTCNTFDFNCAKCVGDKRECAMCVSGMYPNTNGTCTLCDASCNGQCNTSTGVCTGCTTNNVFTDPPGKVCVACKSFDTNCITCASDNTRRCYQCEDTYYPGSDGVCVKCASGCATCSPITGVCSKCVAQYVPSASDTKLCQSCESFDSNCLQCASTFTRTCTTCKTEAMYPQGGKCVPCDSPCNGKCDPTNGNCRSCLSGYVLTSPVSKVCESCQTFDNHCQANSCASNGIRICTNCTAGYFPQSDGRCGVCDTTCGGKCNTVSGVCTGCSSNHVYNPSNTKTCRVCTLLDAKCSTCDTNFGSEKCVSCTSGYYPDSNGKCILCDNTCGGKCNTTTGVCTGCLDGYVKNGMSCISCAAFNADCETCDSNYEKKCTVCKNNKYSVDGVCVDCDGACENCDGVTGNCKSCSENSVVQSGSTTQCETCSTFDSLCVTCASDATRNCVKCTTNNYPVLQLNGEKRCQQCNTTCNGNCYTETGYCKSCLQNYVFVSATSLVCESCKSFDQHCTTCSPTFERKCVTCDTGYYPGSNGTCVVCDSTCANSCDGSTGYCLSCVTGFVLSASPSQHCITCEQFDTYCAECPGGAERKCSVCKAGYYPKTSGDYMCQSCDATCGGKCDTTTGMCAGCTSGYVPTSPITNKCVTCRTFDTNCVECETDKRKCINCQSGMYPNTVSHACVDCDASCNGQCNTSTGVCTGCTTNHVFTDPPGKVCVACKSFDTNCITCLPDFSRKCKVCAIGFYPDETSGKCVACSTIPDCNTCSSDAKKCLTCKDPFIQKSGGCESCPIGEYKFSETTCSKCYNTIDNCNTCDTIAVGKARCNLCISPYVLNGAKCGLCQSNEYFDNTTGTPKCVKNDINCDILLDKENCLDCSDTFFVSNSKCVSSGSCESPTLTSCDCSDQISINSKCTAKMDRCKYQKSEKGVPTCITCVDDNILNNGGVCEQQSVYWLVRNGVVFGCKAGTYLTNQNTCDSCGGSNAVCSTQNKYLTCGDLAILDVQQMACTTDTQCNSVVDGLCVQCKENDMEISKGKCSKCETENCDICVGGTCQICKVNYLMYSANRCVNKEQVNCKRTSQSGCAQCEAGYYQVDTKNIEGKYDFCTKADVELHCKYYSLNKTKCIECQDAFNMKNGVCAEQFDDVNKVNETKMSVYNMKSALKEQEEVDCLTRNNKGCQRCPNGYYLNKNSCEKCVNDCLSCYNATYCTTCNSGYFLDLSMKCQTLGELAKRCEVTLPAGGGCAICKVGYYKVEKDCDACDESCDMCLKKDECLSCKDGYFKIQSESNKLCSSNTTLSNCLQSNLEGCLLCNESYYLQNGRCFSCKESCVTCVNSEECLSCKVDEVLVKGSCVDYHTVLHCTSAYNSQCTSCEGSHKVSDDGENCVSKTNYGIVIGIPVAIFIFFIIIIALILVVVYLLILSRKEKKKMKNICVFEMKRSNIEMVQINSVLSSNKKLIKFNLEDDSSIPVDEETRDLICVGNTTKHNMKVQFSVLEGCDHYEIRTVPTLITLKRGEACEFEIFIKPLCSCHLEEDIMVIALDIETGVQYNEKIKVETSTANSTKLDYHELIDEKKLGEGSFGIVYKGKYHEKTVAIKKMKNAQATKSAIDEFTKEVAMLDKFRSDYIIHFYGACYIPSHVCMVTEFAKHGSLADMFNKEQQIADKMKVKIILDATYGVKYLHENGILHRDIKPDNILVITLEENIKANGKLTDFGSSRNVNQMMTNMTFTKGIGTPKYMAPEVLNKQHYKMSSDVYSLGVTFYEALIWGEAYPKQKFKFAWSIADFVTSGKRLECLDNMNQDAYNIISMMWEDEADKRIKIEKVAEQLQTLFESF
ncbi:protein serine/threonine kinase, putative [Entamoeba invadens IP1]|uniref:Protein serine/threonine kinase, putative n=1 Tax=Entamoeba invadens IP1 TaxID=370355 RepID=A0A0A1UFG1_ENTIV|nr:protein serine/threonine kinase, putative [Entamoeba invadens IP1]ELP91623.1 protein serine/threonine kinase, putative [Entamoeba invadens IP1]|eukprot:XP_004258394.1 protein serine/threonine kinase, putative [Entamoeba invadens IP1]